MLPVFCDEHLLAQESKGRTVAVMEEMDAAARTREIGRMLSGQKLTEEALKNAEPLIRANARHLENVTAARP